MEIIHLVLGKANPNRMNGVNKVVNQLITEQVKHGVDAKLWGITKSKEHDYPTRNFETVLFPEHKNPFKADSVLKRAILEAKSATFHLHGGWIPVYASVAKFMKKNGVKFVITPHGAYNKIAMKRSKWQKKIYFSLFEKAVIKNSHMVHAIGQSESDALKKLDPNAKAMLIPYGFQFEEPKEKLIKKNKFIIGYIGRIDIHTKGLDILLEGFQSFQKKVSCSELWIVGGGDELVKLKAKAQELSIKNVTFHGPKYGEDKDKLYKQMHVFAHPSRNEGLPSAVLEASSFGVPSAVSIETNVGNQITSYNAGVCLKNNNPIELEKAFLSCYTSIENNTWESLSAGAITMVKEAFSWENLLPKYTNLYA